MTGKEFVALARSWGRLGATVPPELDSASHLSTDGLGEAVLRTLGAGLGLDERARGEVARMELEAAVPGENPLLPGQAALLALVLGATAGRRASNGYPDAAESVGLALLRCRSSVHAELAGVSLRAWGEECAVFLSVLSRETGETSDFVFTRAGLPVPREGLERQCAFPLLALRGMGYMLDGGQTLAQAAAAEAGPPPRVGKPGTASAPRRKGGSGAGR